MLGVDGAPFAVDTAEPRPISKLEDELNVSTV